MLRSIRNFRSRTWPFLLTAVLLGTIPALDSCNKPPTTQVSSPQRTFASPQDAGTAFLDAAKTDDQNALLGIFGAAAKDVLYSGDAVKDKKDLQDFVASYNQMNRWGRVNGGGAVLYVGAENFPFPVPLVQNAAGQWYFDGVRGRDEILARRVGKGELTAIAACDALSDAEKAYFSVPRNGSSLHEYAQQIASDEGKQNGLYWPVADGQIASPLGNVGDFAKAAGYTGTGAKPQPFDGYYFRILTKQGSQAQGGAKDYMVDGKMTKGFAILAYPAAYRNSGIMTFIVGPDGVIYQKDLGDATTETAAAMAEYNPNAEWKPAL